MKIEVGARSGAPVGEGTEISWVSEFEPLVPGTGWLVKRRLEPFVAEVAERLARRAESAVPA